MNLTHTTRAIRFFPHGAQPKSRYLEHLAEAIRMPHTEAKADHGRSAVAAPHAGAPAEGPGVEVAMEDWDELFNAVMSRLRSIVSERPATAAQTATDDDFDAVKASVLDCVSALELLHTSMTRERARDHRQVR